MTACRARCRPRRPPAAAWSTTSRPTSTDPPGGRRPPHRDRAGVLRRLDLRTLDAPCGGASRVDAPVPVEPMVLGGQRYLADPDAPELRLDVVRSVNGWHFRLRGGVEVSGPCWRCLEAAHVHVDVDATEVSVDGSDDPDLSSLYVEQGVLDVASWARDAVVEAMPPAVLCREDCAGLCPTCGADLNAGDCGCAAEAPVDARWGALEDLARRMREQDAPGGNPPD